MTKALLGKALQLWLLKGTDAIFPKVQKFLVGDVMTKLSMPDVRLEECTSNKTLSAGNTIAY